MTGVVTGTVYTGHYLPLLQFRINNSNILADRSKAVRPRLLARCDNARCSVGG